MVLILCRVFVCTLLLLLLRPYIYHAVHWFMRWCKWWCVVAIVSIGCGIAVAGLALHCVLHVVLALFLFVVRSG